MRSADIGVNSAYEVVSEVDLDFVPNEEEERKRNAIFKVKSYTISLFKFKKCCHNLNETFISKFYGIIGSNAAR